MNYLNGALLNNYSAILLTPSAADSKEIFENDIQVHQIKLSNFNKLPSQIITNFDSRNVYILSLLALVVSSLSRMNQVFIKINGLEYEKKGEIITWELAKIDTLSNLMQATSEFINFKKLIYESLEDSTQQSAISPDISVSLFEQEQNSDLTQSFFRDISFQGNFHFSFLHTVDYCNLYIFYKKNKIDEDYRNSIKLIFDNLIDKTLKYGENLNLKDPYLYVTHSEVSLESKLATPYNHILQDFKLNLERVPTSLCARSTSASLSYKDVNELADKVCAFIKKKNIVTGTRINILVDRSPYVLPAMIGIWKAQCSVVLIDIRLHKIRKENILEQSNAKLTIEINKDVELSCHETCKWKDIISSTNILETYPEEYDLEDEAYVVFTSGTTGIPKGVSVSHKNIAHYSHSVLSRLNLDKNKQYNFAVVSSLSADLANTCIYPALIHAGSVNFFDYEESVTSELFSKALKECEIDILKIVPSHFFGLMHSDEFLSNLSLPLIIFGGEKLEPDQLLKLYKHHSNMTIYNHYGPSETTVGVFMNLCIPNSTLENVPIGFPLGDTKGIIVDQQNRILPSKFVGELVINGTNVTNGYINITNENPFINIPYVGHCYKTGDIVYTGYQGEFYFYFREDSQYKINGIRIDLSEIDLLLKKICFDIPYYIYFLKNKIYVFLCKADFDKVEYIKLEFKKNLPAYLMPSSIIQLDRLPFNLNGKIDLPTLNKIIEQYKDIELSNFTLLELKLLNLWKLYIGNIYSLTDTIYQNGANSLKATHFLHSIKKELGIDINLGTFMRDPSFNSLRELVNRRRTRKYQPTQQLTQRPKNKPSSFQERMWRVNQLSPNDPSYNSILFVELNKEIGEEKILIALEMVFNKFECLRTRFTWGKDLRLKHDFDLRFEDIFKKIPSKKNLQEVMYCFQKEGINLLNVPPVQIFRCETQILIVLHHIITDRLSNDVLLRALDGVLGGEPSSLEIFKSNIPLIEEVSTNSIYYKRGLSFWKKQLNNVKPLKWPKENLIDKNNKIRTTLLIQEKQTHSLLKIVKNNNISMNVVFLAIINLAISYITNTTYFATLTTISKRKSIEDFNAFGPAIDTLAIITNINPDNSFKEYISKFNSSYAQCLEYSYIDFGDVCRVGRLYAEDGKSSIKVMYNFEEYMDSYNNFKKISYDKLDEKFDLTIVVKEGKGIFEVDFCSLEEIESSTLNHLITAIESIIEAVSFNDFIPLKKIPFKKYEPFKICQKEYKRSFIDYFKHAAVQYPDNICVEESEKSLTYKEVDQLSDCIANHLLEKGLTNAPIALLLPRGSKFIISVLGVLKSNNFYIPLDVSSPHNRIQKIINIAHARETINEINYDEYFISPSKNSFSPTKQTEESYVYMIFTSGSTGEPKGVPIRHNSLINYLLWAGKEYHFTSNTIASMLTSVSYDLTITSYLLPLMYGAKIVVFNPVCNLKALNELIIYEKKIDFLKLTPTHLKIITSSYPYYTFPLKTLVIGGEALYYEDLRKVRESVNVYNEYGPTEATVGCIYKKFLPSLDKSGRVPIGKPIPNTHCIVKGIYDQEVIPGVIGYLLIGGICIFDGYYNSEHSATEIDSFTGRSYYNSKDIVTYQNEEYVYLRRDDGQFKIHGNRVNIEEIELAINNIPLIKTAQVFNVTYKGEKTLVALISINNENENYVSVIYATLEKILPSYMLPEFYIKDDQLIMADGGKVNWESSLNNLQNNRKISYISSEFSGSIAKIKENIRIFWKDLILVGEEINDNKNFFDVGGDSIKIFKLHARIKQNYSIDISVIDLFKYTTIEKQAEFIERKIAKAY